MEDFDLDTWIRHGHTRRLLAQMLANEQTHMSELLSVCSKSSDAEVRAAHQKLMSTRVMVYHLKGGDFKGSNDD